MFSQIKFDSLYYWQYRDLSQKIDFWLKIIVSFTAGASVVNLLLQKSAPGIWLVLVVISQSYRAIEHYLPFQERITRINFLLPPLYMLLNKIEREFEYLDSYEDEKIIELIYTFKTEYHNTVEQFISSYPFPHKKCCEKNANTALKAYFEYNYAFGEEVNNNG